MSHFDEEIRGRISALASPKIQAHFSWLFAALDVNSCVFVLKVLLAKKSRDLFVMTRSVH